MSLHSLFLLVVGDDTLATSNEAGLLIDQDAPAKQIATIDTLHKTFDIWFDFFHTINDVKKYRSIFRLTTTTTNAGNLGDRLPAIHSRPQSRGNNLVLTYTFKDNVKYTIDQPKKIGQWVRFNMRQKLIDGRYIHETFIDGKSVGKVENKNPVIFRNVAVFIGDLIVRPVNGRFDNFKIASPAQNAIFGQFLVHVSTGLGNFTIY